MKRYAIALAIMFGPMPALAQERPPHPLDSIESRCIASYARFRSLRTGMSKHAVYGVMGCDGEMTSETNVGGTRYRTYQWQGNAPGSAMLIVFKGESILNISQANLK